MEERERERKAILFLASFFFGFLERKRKREGTRSDDSDGFQRRRGVRGFFLHGRNGGWGFH